MKIIGITGRKYSGKTTAARLFEKSIAAPTVQISFADSLKEEVAKACSVTVEFVEQNKSLFRPMLQWYGTDLKRNLVSQNYWIDRLREKLTHIDNYTAAVLIPDVRFLNEASFISSLGGILIRIKRPETDNAKDSHLSETEQDQILVDYSLENDGTLIDLKNKIRAVIHGINKNQTPKHHI